MLFATCFHRAMRCTGHSPDTATLTEDVSLLGLFEELIIARDMADEPCQASQLVHAFSCVTSRNTSP